MKTTSINFYRLITALFLLIICVLTYLCYNLLQKRDTYENSISVLSKKANAENYKFGYSDAIEILCQDKNIKLGSINPASDESHLVKIDVTYASDIQSLNDLSFKLRQNKNFYSIDNINIYAMEEGSKKISFSIFFYVFS